MGFHKGGKTSVKFCCLAQSSDCMIVGAKDISLLAALNPNNA